MNPNEENQQPNQQQPGAGQPQPQPDTNWQNPQQPPAQQPVNPSYQPAQPYQQSPDQPQPTQPYPQPQPDQAAQYQQPYPPQPTQEQQQYQQAYLQQQYPEAYQHVYQQQQVDPRYQPAQAPTQAEGQVQPKKNQTKLFIALAAGFVVLVIIGIVVLAQSFGGDETDVPEVALTTNEQLIRDANQLGLGIINFSEGSDPFEITPENTAELRVSYIPQEFNDPRTGEAYALTTAIPGEGAMQYVLGGVCNSDDSVSQSGDNKNFAIRVLLDNGTLHCVERGEIVQLMTQPSPN